jgi:hypothetical protein
MVAPGFSVVCAALKGGSTVDVFSKRNTSRAMPVLMESAVASAGHAKRRVNPIAITQRRPL